MKSALTKALSPGMDEMFEWTSKSALRYMADTSAASDGAALKTSGLLAGGAIATAIGWRPVEALAAGDQVLTFDNGLMPLVEVRRETFLVADMMAPDSYATVVIPQDALGNSKELELLPDQGVLIESEAACDAQGDPFAVVPANALVGFRGITRGAAKKQIEVFTLIFEEEQVVYMQGAVLVHCPPPQIRLSDIGAHKAIYDVVTPEQGRFLIDCMVVEDQMGKSIAPDCHMTPASVEQDPVVIQKEPSCCEVSFFNSVRPFYAATAF